MLRKIYKKYMWKKKMKSIDKEVRSGRTSMNEARKKCGLPPIETGEKYYQSSIW